jgi:hypothetical protein
MLVWVEARELKFCMNMLYYECFKAWFSDFEILDIWVGFLEKMANSQVCNTWKVDTRPTSASDFFRYKKPWNVNICNIIFLQLKPILFIIHMWKVKFDENEKAKIAEFSRATYFFSKNRLRIRYRVLKCYPESSKSETPVWSSRTYTFRAGNE